jgi:alkanesulfonate monooxygenase SsuD/methylene tetrahydromethanopterin reductase-like flavin-dependent oxidoreductase (luciferase family)
MKFGIFPTEGGDRFASVMEECRLAEEVGFESCWVNDHQATEGDNYWPSPLARLAPVAAETDLEVVTSVLILPLYHPLHVAQRTAMLDLMSEGNVTLGVGLGYVQKEFDAFQVPMDERAGRMIEGLRFLDEFLSAGAEETVDFSCPFFEVEDWHPLPETVQDPRPPLWVGGWGDRQLERSVKFGDTWVPGVVVDNAGVEERWPKCRAFAEKHGRDFDAMEHPLMREAVIAPTREEAVELGKEYLYRTYLDEYGGEFEHPYVAQEELESFEKLFGERAIYGSPAEVAEQIEDLKERFPLDHLALRFHHSGMPTDIVQEQIELFGDEVIPAVA